jgi:hypothetical protein
MCPSEGTPLYWARLRWWGHAGCQPGQTLLPCSPYHLLGACTAAKSLVTSVASQGATLWPVGAPALDNTFGVYSTPITSVASQDATLWPAGAPAQDSTFGVYSTPSSLPYEDAEPTQELLLQLLVGDDAWQCRMPQRHLVPPINFPGQALPKASSRRRLAAAAAFPAAASTACSWPHKPFMM